MSDQEKRCGTCKHFVFARSTRYRKLPKRPGKCEWPIPWPTAWPFAYLWSAYGEPRKPHPADPHPDSGERCKCWEPREAVVK